MNADEFRKLFPEASEDTVRINCGTTSVDGASAHPADGAGQDRGPVEPPESQCNPGNSPKTPDEPQKGNPARYLVRVRDFRRRLLDEDNLIAKFHIDALRYGGLLPSDAPGHCKIEVSQEKVLQKAEERVELEIWPPGTWEENK